MSKLELLSYEFEVTAGDFIRGGESASQIKNVMQQLGVDSKIVKKICVACYEAEMNMVIHSLGGKIKATIFKDSIEMKFIDVGPGIEDIELAMKEGYSTASDDARNMGFGAGMGLPNIKRNSDEFEIESCKGKGTEIKLVIYL
ncbi:ATP-binding protein [Oceanirhabdus sp. W0125-5]|uniref:ATP-binding protein n=1 Tax=Oceanirhabdus sp. W0125-5 TaxID=2999116 RepID=UPI0022F2F111|nr:ATP-binding protein [Oceanirhabdus sp. W0125-5]WBW95752.1 ATP-binding protein [Oceanirhabdus sp. W0125-5]